MANNFKSVEQGALSTLDAIIAKTQELDKELASINTKLVQMAKTGVITNVQASVASYEAEIKKLNATLAKQQAQINKLTAARKKSTQEIKSKIPNLKQLKKAKDDEVASTGKAITTYSQLIAKHRQVKTALQNAIVAHGKNSSQVRKATSEYNKYNRKVLQAQKATSNFSKKGLGPMVLGFRNLLGAFGLVGGVTLFASVGKSVYELTKTFDGLGFALERVAGDAELAADSQAFLLDISRKYGTELISTTNRWIKFLAAAKQSGVSLKDTEKIFESMAKVSGVLGLKTDELTGIYLALEQMLSKGKVTTEELRRQLGERLPGAMGIMAQAVGVTVSELDKMLKKGEVLSAVALPKFAKAVELAYSLDNVDRVSTLVAEQNRLTTAWQNFIKNITEGDSVIQKVLGGTLKMLTEMVEYVNILSGGDAVSLDMSISASTDVLEYELEEMAEAQLAMEGFALKRRLKEQEEAINLLKIKKGTSKETMEIAEQEYSDILNALSNHEDEKSEIIKAHAQDNIEEAYREFKELKELKRIGDEAADEAESRDFGNMNALQKFIRQTAIAETREQAFFEATGKNMEYFEDDLADATAKWRVFRKLIEETDVIVPDGTDGDGDGKTRLKNLKTVNELIKEGAEATTIGTAKTINMTKAVKAQIAVMKDMLKDLPEWSGGYMKLSENIEALEKALEGIQATQGMKDVEQWSKDFEESQKKAREEAKRLADQLSDFFGQFTDDFFSNMGFSFLGDLITDMDKFKELLDSSEDDWAIWANTIMEIGQEAFAFLNQNQEAYFNNQLYRLEQERDIAIEFAGDSTAAKEEIERQYDEKRADIMRKQAAAEKKAAMFNIAIDTAQAVIGFLADPGGPDGVGLSIAAGLLGAAQLAMVSSQPIPEYFRGTQNASEGWALVDEKTPEVHTDRLGNIKSFGEDKANYRWLSSGDKIYTSHEDYFNKELNGLLDVNGIDSPKGMVSDIAVNVSSGISRDDFRKEIQRLNDNIMGKPTSVVNLNKKGFETYVATSQGKRRKQNNILTLKGGIV